MKMSLQLMIQILKYNYVLLNVINSLIFPKYGFLSHVSKTWISNSLSHFWFGTSSSLSIALECSAVSVSPSHCQHHYKSSTMVVKGTD